MDMDMVKRPSGHLVVLSPNKTAMGLRTDMRKFQTEISEITKITYEYILAADIQKTKLMKIHLTAQ